MADCLDEGVELDIQTTDDNSEIIVEESVIQEIIETEEFERNSEVERLPEKSEKLFQMPLTRIKALMKQDTDVTLASQEAVIMIAKATELFIETLARESYRFTKQNKKKTIQKKDIDDCIDASEELAFLEAELDDRKNIYNFSFTFHGTLE